MKPKFNLSKSKLLTQYNTVKELADIVSYSFKTNNIVGTILEESTTCFFSIHTKEATNKIKDKKRIWFLAQGWTETDIDELTNKGISHFVVDNTVDLTTLENYIKKTNRKIHLLLRMNLKENTIFTGRYFVFGMKQDEINSKIPILAKNKNIEKLGIHFHRKTQNINEWSIKEELEEKLTKEVFNCIDIINIGGGLPTKYKNSNDDTLNYIFSKIKELKQHLNKKNIKLIIEPGRFLAAPCITLETHIKSIINKNIIINASVYNSSMDTLIAPLKLLVEGEEESGKEYLIKGCTPCSMDIFRYSVHLKNPKIGDKITFLNAGAYNFHTTFCSLPKIETDIIHGNARKTQEHGRSE